VQMRCRYNRYKRLLIAEPVWTPQGETRRAAYIWKPDVDLI
jgi:hypothetical protein